MHEFAHKLDELTGAPNGLPPLHADMNVAVWSAAMTQAYKAFNARLDRDEEPPFDDYAGSDPAEFFAVVSELFFAAPDVLDRCLSRRLRAAARVLSAGPDRGVRSRFRSDGSVDENRAAQRVEIAPARAPVGHVAIHQPLEAGGHDRGV